MRRAYVGVTDNRWAAFLRARPHLDEVNFWKPSATSFRALNRGDPFLFKTHSPGNRLVGGGFFTEYRQLRVSEAWRFFEEGNGVASHDQLLRMITAYQSRNSSLGVDADPMIGCILLDGVFFVDDDLSMASPPDFAPNIVSGKGYPLDGGSYVEGALERLLANSGVRVVGDDGQPTIIPGPLFLEEPQLVLARAGQRSFRAAVTAAYDRRCAVTGNHITPVLQAAHIRPVADQGENRVDNGLLLRSDVHILYDQGYLGIDAARRLQVSPRLRTDFGNGAEFYARQGMEIALPQRKVDWPDPDAATWHMDTRFRVA
jgi:putative restriction endonuclease